MRVYMSDIGHPLTGDSLYGGEAPELIGRQALHACMLSFRHPATGEKMIVEAPIPDDLKE